MPEKAHDEVWLRRVAERKHTANYGTHGNFQFSGSVNLRLNLLIPSYELATHILQIQKLSPSQECWDLDCETQVDGEMRGESF